MHPARAGRRCASATALAATVVLLATGCHGGGSAAPGGAGTSSGSARSSATASPPAPTASSAAPGDSPATALPAPGTGSLASYYRQRPHWHPCGSADEEAGVTLVGFDCTTVLVPLDYAHPRRRAIAIALDRAPTDEPRAGTLFVNPGGPGASGIAYLPQAVDALPQPVRDRFDVVGFDPRGVGRSAPVECLGGAELDAYLAQPPSPATPAEERALLDGLRRFSRACAAHSGWELPFVGTGFAARDLDILRAVVGDRRLTYLGKSYGTVLGATYADTFPHRVRALVLDGAVDPALPGTTSLRQQGQGFEAELHDFLADCVRRTDCPLGRDLAAAASRLDRLLAAIRRHPLPSASAGHGPLTLGYAMTGISVCLYSADLWSYLRLGLAHALAGDGALLMRLADSYNQRQPDGSYTNLLAAFFAIGCADGPAHLPVARARAYAASWSRGAPHYGAQEAWSLVQCDWWPAPLRSAPHLRRAAGAPPILVVGTTGDPATPFAWARGLATELESGRLLGYRGIGHTAYAEDKSHCVDATVDAYLIHLRAPRDGTMCG